MIHLLTGPALLYQLLLQVTVQWRRCWFFSLPSVCAGSEHAPVHTVPRCSLASLVNHLPVTGGGNTTAGLAVQRCRLAHSRLRCLALLPLEMTVCHIFVMQEKERKKEVVQVCISLSKQLMLAIFKNIPETYLSTVWRCSVFMVVWIQALIICVFALHSLWMCFSL